MAKRKTPQVVQDTSPDYLVKPKEQFELDLTERILIGEELSSRQINDRQELGQLHSDYIFWHDFNSELLKRAFDRTNNQYYKDYTMTPSAYVISLAPEPPPSFQEQIAKKKRDILKHVTRLKKIKEKLILIDELPGLQPIQDKTEVDKLAEGLNYLGKIFSKFHRVAQSLRHRHSNRETIVIKDEYDVQDLLRGLLQIYFEDVREEDYSPS